MSRDCGKNSIKGETVKPLQKSINLQKDERENYRARYK